MANPTWTVTVLSLATDGINLYLEVQISNGQTTFPIIRPVFELGTTVATIEAYLQSVADIHPTIFSDVAVLCGRTYTSGT